MFGWNSSKNILSHSENQAKIILLEAEIIKLKTEMDVLKRVVQSLRGYVYKKQGNFEEFDKSESLNKQEPLGIAGIKL